MLTSFMIALFVGLLLAAALFWLLIRRLRVNWNRANRSPWLYLLPVFITLAFIWVSVTQVYPRVLDIAYIASGNFDIEDVVIGREMADGAALRLERGAVLIPRSEIPAAGTNVRLFITPHSRHVIKLETIAVDQATANGLPSR